jgi:endoglucanase
VLDARPIFGWTAALLLAWSAAGATGLAPVPATRPSILPLFGVNLCGAEFGEGHIPGIFGTDYTYPAARQLDYYQRNAVSLVRLPFRWERLQRTLNGALDGSELARLDAFIASCRDRRMRVILDPHNFARYGGELIGSEQVPCAAFADFWEKLAGHYRDEEAIFAFGLMNEPHDTGGLWPAAAQAAVDAIRRRAGAARQFILVPGDNWACAKDWRKYNETLAVDDPAGRVLYEVHLYFDPDSKGTYELSYDKAATTEDLGARRIGPFLQWLDEHHVQGFVGEIGVPGDDPRWLALLDSTLALLKSRGVGACYWAGGPWWKDYPLSIEPAADGRDRPQMEVWRRHQGEPGGAAKD